MDGESREVRPCNWPIEEIPHSDFVYRQVPPPDRIGQKPGKYPNAGHFSLKPDEKGLSVNWDKYVTLKSIFELISLRVNKKGNFTDYMGFKIFKFPVSLLKTFDKIADVEHDPDCRGNPAPHGTPNNRAHSLIMHEDDEEIRLKLSEYCRDNHSESYCDFIITTTLEDEIEEIRINGNSSFYHQCNWPAVNGED
ncbi:MAG: hypothetical protein WD267_04045 [Balneolales bacterium]